MTTFQKTIVTATVAVLAGAGIYEFRQAAQLREQVLTLQQQQAQASAQVQKLMAERDEALSQVSVQKQRLTEENANKGGVKAVGAETHRLLSESAKKRAAMMEGMRRIQNRATGTMNQSTNFIGNIQLLKDAFERMPDKKIPELVLLDDSDWLNVVTRPFGGTNAIPFGNDDGLRRFMSEARDEAKRKFARSLGAALARFIQENGGQTPSDISQLNPYLRPPATATMLDRYQLAPSNSDGSPVITEKSAVDDQFDSLFQINETSYVFEGIGKGAKGSGSWGNGSNNLAHRDSSALAQRIDSERRFHNAEVRMLDAKLKPIERLLTPEQFQTYRQKKLEQLEKEDEAIELLKSFEPEPQ